MEVWVEIITNLGLPIAMVVAMAFFIWNLYKDSKVREEKLIQVNAECRAANEKAIETLTLYAERLGVIETDVREIKDILNN